MPNILGEFYQLSWVLSRHVALSDFNMMSWSRCQKLALADWYSDNTCLRLIQVSHNLKVDTISRISAGNNQLPDLQNNQVHGRCCISRSYVKRTKKEIIQRLKKMLP